MPDYGSSSFIELNRSSFKENVAFIRKIIGEDVEFCSVIKGNAYGHGMKWFIPLAEECGIGHFAVFSSDEAVRAHRASTKESHIMIMGMVEKEALEWVIGHDMSFFVFDQSRLKAAIRAAKNVGKSARIHLHLETGMNRLGLEWEELPSVVSTIKKASAHLQIEGICTHYAGAESIGNHVRVSSQIKQFKKLADWLQDQGIEGKYRHSACSAAVLNYPETIMDMVRIGISQYGFWPNQETYMNYVKNNSTARRPFEDPLNRILSWKSKVMSIKEVKAGSFVGYGNVYLTGRDQVIAVIPVGYSHGFARNLTNVGIVLINGHRAPVAGLVNMNLLTVDVTDIPDVSKGDEVVIIGEQMGSEITVSSFSEMSNYMNYEVLVRLPSEIPRKIIP